MTFFIKELIFSASETAWNTIQSDLTVRRNLYSLKGKIEHNWSDPSQKHNYSEQGLFDIRPICSAESAAKTWFEAKVRVANPNDFVLGENIPLEINPLNIQPKTCLNLGSFQAEIPLHILHYAKALSKRISSNVIYYDACYWGERPEYELAWIFGQGEEVILQLTSNEDQEKICRIKADTETVSTASVLQCALQTLDVAMSSDFFLPHTRSFPWIENKVR